MRRIILIYVLATLVVACRYEAPSQQASQRRLIERTVWVRTDLSGKRIHQEFALQPKVLSRCEAGSVLGPDHGVASPSASFRAQDPVYLSMWLANAPEGLQVSMRVLDAKADEIGVARRDDAGGARLVTLQVGEDLPPGKYKLQGFWGGNLVCEKDVVVEK